MNPITERHVQAIWYDAALARGVVEKRGSWLAYGEENLAQGTLAAIAELKARPELVAELVARIKDSPAAVKPARKAA